MSRIITIYSKAAAVFAVIAITCVLFVGFWIHLIIGVCFVGLLAWEFYETAQRLHKEKIEQFHPKAPDVKQ